MVRRCVARTGLDSFEADPRSAALAAQRSDRETPDEWPGGLIDRPRCCGHRIPCPAFCRIGERGRSRVALYRLDASPAFPKVGAVGTADRTGR